MESFEKQYYESPSFWEGSALLDEGNKIRIVETIRNIPTDVNNLADIGCGNGVFISKLMELRPNIMTTGLDRSDEALKYVKGKKKVGEITNLPFESKSFDCVSCLEVIEHLNVNDFNVALNELSRISSKYIIIGVPYEEKIEKNIANCPKCHSSFNKDLHMQSFDREKLDNLFNDDKIKLLKFVNVVKSKEYYGLSSYLKFKEKLNNTKSNFDSPICIVCGHKNSLFKLDVNKPITKSINSKNLIYIFKRIVKSIYPKTEINGYWAICLYEKKS